MKQLFSLMLFLSGIGSLCAQMPETDIYLVDMHVNSGVYTFDNPVNITNRKGYDNQPYFSAQGNMIYYVADYSGKQTDIMLYGLQDGKSIQLTNTPESEFSPTVMRGTDYISCVRVEKDSSQHVYRYTKTGNYPVDLTPKNDSVGYHAWVDDYHIALFVLDSIRTLQVVEVRSQTYDTIALNPGRSLQTLSFVPEILYTQMNADSIWEIKKYNYKSKEKLDWAVLPKGVEDFSITRDGKLMCGKEGKLLMINPYQKESQWREVADFSKAVGSFYRIAVSPRNDKIAIVGFKGKKP